MWQDEIDMKLLSEKLLKKEAVNEVLYRALFVRACNCDMSAQL